MNSFPPELDLRREKKAHQLTSAKNRRSDRPGSPTTHQALAMSSMSLPRVLRRKSRLDSTRNSSSTKHTDSPLLSSNGLQFQHTDPTHSAPSMFLSSTINASQEWSKRILHSIRPSAQDATVIRGLAGDCGDGEVSPGFPPSRPETARRTQQVE